MESGVARKKIKNDFEIYQDQLKQEIRSNCNYNAGYQWIYKKIKKLFLLMEKMKIL